MTGAAYKKKGGGGGPEAQNFQKMRQQKFLFEYSRIILMRVKEGGKKHPDKIPEGI